MTRCGKAIQVDLKVGKEKRDPVDNEKKVCITIESQDLLNLIQFFFISNILSISNILFILNVSLS